MEKTIRVDVPDEHTKEFHFGKPFDSANYDGKVVTPSRTFDLYLNGKVIGSIEIRLEHLKDLDREGIILDARIVNYLTEDGYLGG